MKKGLLFLVIVCATFNLFVSCSKPYGIQFEKETYDFGEVEVGADVAYSYVFRNTGTNPLIIENVQPSCGCTTTLGWDRSVEPGKTGKIPITFKPPSFNGETTKFINVKTNVPEHQSIRLTLKGRTIIPIDIVPLNTWLGEVNKETRVLSGSYTIENNTHSKIKILEVVPPPGNIMYNLSVVEEGWKYKLDYSMDPPFDGKETVSKQFTIKTDDKKHEYVYPKFYYFVPPPLRVFPTQIYIDMERLNRANIYDIDIKSGMTEPVKVLNIVLHGGNGITYTLKENVKDKYYQISLKVPIDFKFSENEKTFITFRVQNDPAKTLYSIPIDSTKNKK